MTAPGWYNDEQDPSVARWHDGTDWTEHTMAKGSWPGPGSPPPPSGAAAGPPPEGPALGRRREVSTTWLEAPPAPDRPARPQWERPSGHFIAALASLITIAVCLLVLQRLDDDHDKAAVAASTTTTLPATTAEWGTVDGSTYRITVTPSSAASDEPSPNGCLGAPAAGHTNLRFTLRIENLSPDKAAPVPQVALGTNVSRAGRVDPAITTLDGASTSIEVGPVAAGTSCSLARAIAAGSGSALTPGGFTEYSGVAGGLPSPVPNDLTLIVRYFAADAAQVARGTGFSAVDLLVPFPDVAAT